MDFIYFIFPVLLVLFVAGLLFRNRTRPGKTNVTRSRAWRDQSVPAHPFSNTVLVTENDATTYAAFASTSSPSSDSVLTQACSDFGDISSACSDTSSTTP